MKKDKFIIGALEDLALPDWGIARLRARVDTGARTSAIHVEDIRLLPNHRARFYVVVGWRKTRRRIRVVARIMKRDTVLPTTGAAVKRLFVKTTMTLGPVTRKIELSLADREHMTYRMLLGRSALGSDFLVDPSRPRLLGRKRIAG